MNSPIKTAVFPVAGLGSRFLPVTKAGPKEMLPILDKPLIQYVVDEALAVGIQQLVFVTSSSKRAIEDYFDSNYELESRLEQKGDFKSLKVVRDVLPPNVSVVYVRQPHPLGLGDAVLRAKDVVGQNPFAVLLADDIMEMGAKACLANMIAMYQEQRASVIAVQAIPKEDSEKYGIIALGSDQQRVTQIVEKPSPENAPSNLAVTGRYILTPAIFTYLQQVERGVGGEIQLTDAIAKLLQHEKVLACPLKGLRYDCGTRVGFLEASIAFALKHPELRDRVAKFLNNLETV